MNKLCFTLVGCVLAFLPSISAAESAEPTEQSLKAAEVKLACCYKQASENLIAMGRKDSDGVLKESQAAWEKYRDAEIAFEMGDVSRDNDTGRQYYATIRLRLTTERIEALQRVFEHTLCNPSEVRVHNASDTFFKDVVVGNKKYGDIKRGATTDYQHWEVAYRYSFVSLTADSKPLKIQPIDFVGETPLGEGKFTYVLTIENGQLEIRAAKDNP